MTRWCFLCCSAIALWSRTAAADDWLVSLPPCSTEAHGVQPRFEIVYPRPGLPGLLQAGDDLIARVRVPSPLTPPPGVQQPRALAGFSAALIGRSRVLGSGAGYGAGAHRYPIEAVDVRPDAGSSLLYRVALRVPAFAAPGTYDLELTAPGGRGRVADAVRVLAPGAAPRFAWLARPSDLGGAAAAALPIDLWMRAGPALGEEGGEAQPAQGAAPLFDPGALALAVRAGGQLWQFGSCGGPTDMFAAEMNTALAGERLARGKPPSAVVATGQFQRFGADAQALPEAGMLQLDIEAAPAAVAVAPSYPGPAELDFAIAAAHTVRIEGAEVIFHPGSDIGGRLPVRIARLRIAPGGRARMAIEPMQARAPGYALVASPAVARSGERIRFSLRPLAPSAQAAPPRAAFRFGPLHTAFGTTADHAFIALGPHRVHALFVEADGRAHPLETEVRVQTARAGCSAAKDPAATAAVSLWPAVLLLQRRRLTPKKGADRSTRE